MTKTVNKIEKKDRTHLRRGVNKLVNYAEVVKTSTPVRAPLTISIPKNELIEEIGSGKSPESNPIRLGISPKKQEALTPEPVPLKSNLIPRGWVNVARRLWPRKKMKSLDTLDPELYYKCYQEMKGIIPNPSKYNMVEQKATYISPDVFVDAKEMAQIEEKQNKYNDENDGNAPRPPGDFDKTLSLIEKAIHSKNRQEVMGACWSLSFISDGNDNLIRDDIVSSLAPKLIKLLQTEVGIILPTLRTIGNIIAGTDDRTQIFVDLNIVNTLLLLLDKTLYSDEIRKTTCWVISNITAGNNVQIQTVIDNDPIIPTLIKIIREEKKLASQKRLCYTDAVWAISNICSEKLKIPQILYLVAHGTIEVLCEVLGCTRQSIQLTTTVLKGFTNILNMYYHPNLEDYRNTPNTIIILPELKTRIRELQLHPDKNVCNMATRFMEMERRRVVRSLDEEFNDDAAFDGLSVNDKNKLELAFMNEKNAIDDDETWRRYVYKWSEMNRIDDHLKDIWDELVIPPHSNSLPGDQVLLDKFNRKFKDFRRADEDLRQPLRRLNAEEMYFVMSEDDENISSMLCSLPSNHEIFHAEAHIRAHARVHVDRMISSRKICAILAAAADTAPL